MADAAVIETEPETIPADAAALLGPSLVAEMPPAEPAVLAVDSEKSAEKPAKPATGSAPSAAAPAAKGSKAGSTKPATDVDGRTFDPLIHETTDDGQPVLRTDGRTLKKRRVPLKEYRTTSTVGEVPAEGDPAAEPAPEVQTPAEDAAKAEMMIKASAATMTGVQLSLMRLALGPACGNQDPEREGLMQCWEEVLRYHGVSTVNPWIGLAMVSGMVAFRAVHEPANESAVTKLKHWFQRKGLAVWQWITGRRTEKPAPTKREPVNQPHQPEAPAGA